MYARFVKCAVKYELGDAVESVVDSLLAHGHQRLDQLIIHTQMPPLHVKKALMILIRHEMVQITTEVIKTKKPSTSTATPKTRSIYELNPDVIVQRNRFALYLAWIREKWGTDGEAIMQALAQHGKLPARQAIDLACAYLRQKDEKTDEKSLSLRRQRLDVIFRSLIASSVIKRALNFSDRQRLQQQQSLSLLQQLQADEINEKEEEAKKKSTTPKSTKKRKATDDDKDDTPAPKTFKKLRRIKDTDDDTPSTTPVPTSSLPPITTTEIEDTKTQPTDDDSSGEESQWSISHDAFTSEFRIKAIVDHVQERINPTAGHIIRVLMEHYPADITQKPIFNLEQINDLYQAMDGVPELTLATLEQYCEEMAQDSIGILDRVPEGFMINKSKMFDELKTKHIQSVAREKHGQLGGRILRLLLVNKKLEEAQIAELATAPKKTTRETLYAMLKSNFLTLSEVPRSADRQPARSFFFMGSTTRTN